MSLFFVPATILCGVLLIDDCNRHQFACGGRQGLLITHTKRRWEDNGRQIRGFGGEKSPLHRRGERQRSLYSITTRTLSSLRLSTWSNKWSISGGRAFSVPFKNKNGQIGLLLYNSKVCWLVWLGCKLDNPLFLGWEYQPAPWWPVMGARPEVM